MVVKAWETATETKSLKGTPPCLSVCVREGPSVRECPKPRELQAASPGIRGQLLNTEY